MHSPFAAPGFGCKIYVLYIYIYSDIELQFLSLESLWFLFIFKLGWKFENLKIISIIVLQKASSQRMKMIICKEQGTRIQSATTARKEKTTRPATSGPLREEHLNYTGFLWFFFKSMTSKTVANLLFHVGLVLVLCQKMGNLHSILDSLASFSPDITRTASCVYLLAHRSRRQKPCLIPVHFDMCWHRSCVHASFSESRLSEQQVLTRANLVFDLHNSPVQMHNS